MLYWLLYLKLFHYFPPFRIFRYLTFRTAFASLTALFTGLIVGPLVINRLREFQIGQYIREEGPKAHQKKAGTPTMGGLLIAIAIVVPTLLWADLTNPFVWIAIASTCAFAAVGFADQVARCRQIAQRQPWQLLQQRVQVEHLATLAPGAVDHDQAQF